MSITPISVSIMLLVIAILISVGLFMVNALTIDKSVYLINEPVTITITDISNLELWMNDVQKLIPSTHSSIFIPHQLGEYDLCLVNTSSKQKIQCVEFMVLSQSQLENNSIRNTSYEYLFEDYREKNIAGLKNTCDDTIISTENSALFLGQTVNIRIINEPDINTYTELNIVHDNTVYKLFNARGEAAFVPSSVGDYEIFYICDNKVVRNARFIVNPPLQNVLATEDVISKDVVTQEKPVSQWPLPPNTLLLQDSRKNVAEHGLDIILVNKSKVLASMRSPIKNVNKITFHGLDVREMNPLKIEDIDNAVVNGEAALKSYAIDPTGLDFEYATISAIATGNSLYKCKDYDFDNQLCFGNWEKVRDINPGEEYRITLTPEDPIFSELNSSIRCSCQHSATSDDGTRQCQIYCPFTINIPADTTSFHMSEIRYNVTILVTTGGTKTGGLHYGYWDHDQDHTDADDVRVGSSTSTADTVTLIWTNNTIPSTGARSFTQDDCDNWPNYCTYYIYLNASMSFTTPGGSTRAALVNISLNSVNYTLNYTVPGAFSVVLNYPENDAAFSYNNILFNYTPSSSNFLSNCSLFTSESGWNIRNTSYSITNGTMNVLGWWFNQDGSFLWNVRCTDGVTNTTTWGVLNRTINIDTTPPSISLLYPGNGSTVTSSNLITFIYNVSDLTNIQNCSLYIDGSPVQTSLSVIRNQNETFQYLLQNGAYNWAVGCYDSAGHFNISSTYQFNVSVAAYILRGTWYETSTSNCGSIPCAISAAQQTDGTNNFITGTITSGGTATIAQATSSYLSGDGGVISSGSTVSFSTYFQSRGGNGMSATWYLYVRNTSNQDTLICSSTGAGTIGNAAAYTGSCTATSTMRFRATDRFYYVIDVINGNPPGAKDINHTIDHESSFFNLTNYTQLGILSTQLNAPTTNLSLFQGDSFNTICGITCFAGTCFNTNAYVQTNTSGTWTNIGASGVLTLNGSQTNPNSIGTIFNISTNSTFAINASQQGTTYIRCYTNTTYSNASSSQIIRVVVQAYQAPVITLNYPNNNTWVNTSNITFRYTPTTLSPLQNCSLYINGVYNQTNSTPTPNVQNNFTLNNVAEGSYNWSVSCIDNNLLEGYSGVYYFNVDTQKPYSIELHNPEPAYFTTNPYVMFNWTAYDNIANNLTCRLRINNVINQTVISFNGTPTNITIGQFSIGTYHWNVTCFDYANNSNTSATRNFTVSDEPPVVRLFSPANNTGVNTLTPTLVYNASDNFALTECRLYINGVFNQTNQSGLVNGLNNFTLNVQEQWYNWSVMCSDNGGNNASTQNFTFRVDVTYPSIQLFAPAPSQYFENSTVRFNFTATDYPTSVLQCIVYVDDSPSIWVNATSGVQQSVLGYWYPDGLHYWNVSCTDFAYNSNFSETRNFTINETPRITINYPPNNTFISGNVTFNYTPRDNDGFEFCALYINGVLNQTNSTPIVNASINNFTLINPAEGYYDWSILCIDAGIYSNEFMTQNRTLIIDNSPPIVNLSSPAEDFVIDDETYSFNWSVMDNFDDAMICSIYMNNTLNVSGIISQNGSLSNYTISGLRTGSYNWYVSCIDNASLTGVSSTWNFTVILPPKVTLVSPANYTGGSSNQVTFTYIPSLGSGSFPNCSLILNGQVNETNYSITPEIENSIIVNLPEGKYDWNVQCYDTNNLLGYYQYNWTYFVDSTDPYMLNLIRPQNNSVETRNNVSFVFEVFDSISEILSCDIYLNDSGIVYPLISNVNVSNGTNYTHYELLPDGTYSWSAFCIDLGDNFIESPYYNFTIVAPPNVTLVWPPNFYWNNTGSFNLIYLPQDDFQIVNCSLYINGLANQTNTIIFNGQNNSFPINNYPSGEYNWSVGCYDSDDNLYIPPNRTFYIDMFAPTINLTNPFNNQVLASSNVSFNFTASDNMAHNLTCSIYINGTLNQSGIIVNNSVPTIVNVAGFNDGYYDWYVNCTDQALNTNISLRQNFSVQEPPRIVLGVPNNGTRSNSMNWTIYFTPYDNSGSLTSCTLILNNQQNETLNALTSGVQYGINVTGLTHGNYTWDVNCTDPSGNTGINGTSKIFYVDLMGPEIFLDYPPNALIFNNNNITFNWTAYDFNSTTLLNCTLFVTDTPVNRIITGIMGFSGTVFNYTLSNLSDGMHYWNVTCYDDFSNQENSTTRNFIINQPDLYINNSRILFNNTNPNLNESINITANVSNIGGIDANNVIVEFWDGMPGSGILIGNVTGSVLFNSSTIFSTLWNITEGYHIINIIVDPYNYINELNETNNNATRNISLLRSMINYPVNNTPFNYGNISINFTVIDYTTNTINYTIFVNNAQNVTGSTTDNLSTIVNLTLSQGIHKINVEALDALGRKKNSTAIYVIIDYSAPIPVINTGNNTWFNISNPQINISVTDNIDLLLDYKLYINNTLGPQGNITNGTSILVNLSGLGDGIYNLTLEASDDLNNTANSTVKVIYIDTSAPSIILHNPLNGQNFTTRTINFNFTVNDNLASYAMCNLSIDGVPVAGFNATIGVTQNYTVNNLGEGAHYWNVTCRDQAFNYNTSETRIFNIFIPPAIVLVSPANNTWSRFENNTFFYNVSDDTGLANCSIILNGVINQTKNNAQLTNNATNNFTVEFMQSGAYDWQIECYDNTTFNSYNISTSRRLYVDTIAPMPYIETQNNTWFNTTTPLIQINITDNMAATLNYTAYVDGLYNTNGTVQNSTSTNITLAPLTNGIHTVIIEGIDTAGNKQNSTLIIIYVDTIKPTITLIHPGNDTNLTSAFTELNFTVVDNLAEYLNCTVTLDSLAIANLNVSNNTQTSVPVNGLAGGYHNWNVTCIDIARNANTSLTYRFFVVLPDIYVNTSFIYFTVASPIENDTTNITAEIRNIGQNDANNFTVEIRLGSLTGQLLGSFLMNLTMNESKNVTTAYTLPIGDAIFHVLADVPLASNGTVYESDETNNNASRTITVGSWQYVLGYQGGRLAVQDPAYSTVFDWMVQNTTGGNILAADVDSNINWLNLTALSRDTSNQYILDDFHTLDRAFGMENNSDSINSTYTLSGLPKELDNITVFNKQVIDIPIFSSTNNSNFFTGILWDAGDGGNTFNASQDVLFITRISMNTIGYNGTYDFELRVPARLREYTGGTDAVALYAELS